MLKKLKLLLIIMIPVSCNHFSYSASSYQQLKNVQAASPNVDFDESMQKTKYHSFLQEQSLILKYEFFKELFNKHKPQTLKLHKNPLIPKKIHQIWLGGPLPERFKKWQKTWIKHHPDWQYKLWTDDDVEAFRMKNKKYFDEAKNYGEKGDIFRYEILERHGGLYIDVDFECYQSFDILHHLYSFYAGLEPLDTTTFHVGSALIGAAPHHPILRALVRNIAHQYAKGPQDPVTKTGPRFLTETILDSAPYHKRDIILPASYFFPRDYKTQGTDNHTWKKPESFGVHYWSASWA